MGWATYRCTLKDSDLAPQLPTKRKVEARGYARAAKAFVRMDAPRVCLLLGYVDVIVEAPSGKVKHLRVCVVVHTTGPVPKFVAGNLPVGHGCFRGALPRTLNPAANSSMLGL